MPLLLLVLGLAFPRLVIFLLWLLTNWFSRLNDWAIAILGFVLMPYTLLWYTAVLNWYGGIFDFWQSLILLVAVVTDIYNLFSYIRTGYYYEY
jgi:hypothetical protein